LRLVSAAATDIFDALETGGQAHLTEAGTKIDQAIAAIQPAASIPRSPSGH
jgi:hypothetical protein